MNLTNSCQNVLLKRSEAYFEISKSFKYIKTLKLIAWLCIAQDLPNPHIKKILAGMKVLGQRELNKAESRSYMEFRSVSWSGTCQLLWIMMRSRTPAKEWAIFIVWASERREKKTEGERDSSIQHKRIKFYVTGGSNKYSHLCSFLSNVWERDCKVCWLVPFFSLGFWSSFMVPSWSAQSYIVKLRSILPGDSPVTETSASSVTLNPLVTFRLRPLNVFDFV